jgi:hypothetical protein
MRKAEETRNLKPYAAPVLTVHGDVREVTRSVSGSGSADNKTIGMGMANKTFRTA